MIKKKIFFLFVSVVQVCSGFAQEVTMDKTVHDGFITAENLIESTLKYNKKTTNNQKIENADPNLGIIPVPVSIKKAEGIFKLGTFIQLLTVGVTNPNLIKFAKDIVAENTDTRHIDYIQPNAYYKIILDKSVKLPEEGYKLSITQAGVKVLAKTERGLFYGLQTLLQLFPQKTGYSESISLPFVEIEDYPRYSYRGMHLDVGRHFFPASFIKKYIDLLAQYKLNTFHWHLTEDQGWRIEIKKYPKLTQIGGFRDQTLIGNFHDRFPQWFDHTRYGGFYTQDEVKDIVAYAAAKFITVIPEIEMPGHSMAALAGYPELACKANPGPFKVAEKWGIFNDVYCAGKENTFAFLEDVLSEVMALFPSQYIHIGGDECPKTRWKECPYCQKRIQDQKLKDEHELQSYFIQRIEKFINSKGRKIIGWDEILEGGLAPNATVMSWQGTAGGIAAAKQNHDVIMTPQNYVYFDHSQGKSDQEPLAIGGNTPLQEVYSYDPTPTSLSVEQQKRILGVQANVWTEYMPTIPKVEYMIFPRIYALAEIAWSSLDRKNYTNFSQERVPQHLAKLDRTATVYRVPTVIGVQDTSMVGSQFSFDLISPVKGAKIYYTIDGYTPRETDQVYDKSIEITVPPNEKRFLKTIVITPSGRRSAVTHVELNNLHPLKPVDAPAVQPGLNYYFIPGDFDSTSEIDILRASEKGVTNAALNLTSFSKKARSFGLVFTGYINIVEDGIYTFTSLSDDGSKVVIDDQTVVNNDGKHARFALTAGVSLLKGFHKIEIRYFQVGGSSTLKLFMAEPGKPKAEMPPGLLFH